MESAKKKPQKNGCPGSCRRQGGNWDAGAPRRCTETSPASRRLAPAPAALGTRALLILGRAPRGRRAADASVAQALERGSSPQHIDETLRIIAHVRALDCLVQAVGADVVSRMGKPLFCAGKTLQKTAAGIFAEQQCFMRRRLFRTLTSPLQVRNELIGGSSQQRARVVGRQARESFSDLRRNS
jgi:hypothetical protein